MFDVVYLMVHVRLQLGNKCSDGFPEGNSFLVLIIIPEFNIPFCVFPFFLVTVAIAPNSHTDGDGRDVGCIAR